MNPLSRCSTLAARTLLALLLLGACSPGDDGRDGDATRTQVTLSPTVPVAAAAHPFELAVPLCEELPDPADSLDWSGAQWAEFPDPIRTRDALLLALEFPYVVEYWGGSGAREGWIVIGVSGGAVELQAVLDVNFPGARVLAMPLDWTTTELRALAAAADSATSELALRAPAVISVSRGMVRVQLGNITEDRMATLAQFAGERVCVDGEFA